MFPRQVFYILKKTEDDQVKVPTLSEAIEQLTTSDVLIEGYVGKKSFLPMEERAQNLINTITTQNATAFKVKKVAVSSLEEFANLINKVENDPNFKCWVPKMQED